MQAATIAYTYDHDNDGGTTAAVAVSLTRHRETPDSSIYRTGSHADTVQTDLAQFSRTAAKRSGEYLGNEKTSYKRTKTFLVDDASGNEIKANAIAEVSFSLPFGMTPAQKLDFLMELVGFASDTDGKAALIALLTYQDV